VLACFNGIMPKPSPETRLYHLAEAAVWQAQQTEAVYTPTAFAQEGFVHCSTAQQLPGTFRRFYAGRQDLLLLTLDPADLPVIYENLEGGEVLFPHLYAPLPKTALLAVQSVNISAGSDTLTDAQWEQLL